MTISLFRPNINIGLYTLLYVRAKTPAESFNKADSLPLLDKRKQSGTRNRAKRAYTNPQWCNKEPIESLNKEMSFL